MGRRTTAALALLTVFAPPSVCQPSASSGVALQPAVALPAPPSCPSVEYDAAVLRAECLDFINVCGPCAHELTRQMLPALAASNAAGSWASALNACLPAYLRPLLTIIPTRLFALQRCDLAPHIAQLTTPPRESSAARANNDAASIPPPDDANLLAMFMANLPDELAANLNPLTFPSAAPANDVQVRISGVEDVVAQLVREQAQEVMGATSYPNLAGTLQTTAENVMRELTAAMAGAPPSALLNTLLDGVRTVTGVPPPPPPPQQPRGAVARFFARFNPRLSDTTTQPAATAAEVSRTQQLFARLMDNALPLVVPSPPAQAAVQDLWSRLMSSQTAVSPPAATMPPAPSPSQASAQDAGAVFAALMDSAGLAWMVPPPPPPPPSSSPGWTSRASALDIFANLVDHAGAVSPPTVPPWPSPPKPAPTPPASFLALPSQPPPPLQTAPSPPMLASPLPPAPALALSQEIVRAEPAPPPEYALDAESSEPTFPVAPAPPLPQVSASAGPDAPETTHQVLVPINITDPDTADDVFTPDGHHMDHAIEDDTKQSDNESAASVAATLLVARVLCAGWVVALL